MASRSPDPVGPQELRRRRSRALRVARSLGFVGRVEYRHVYSQTGGAQYGQGIGDQGDLLTLFAEAYERDANPNDFSLTAIIAHERGHQVVVRHPRLAARLAMLSLPAEEVVASVIGALVIGPGQDANDLLTKALAAVLDTGTEPAVAARLVQNLCDTLGGLL